MQEVVRSDSGQEHVSLKEAGLRAGSRLKGLRVYAINGIHLCKRQLSSCVALFSFDFFFNIYSIFFHFLWELSSQINYGCELSSSVKPQCKGLTLQPCSGVGRAPNLVLTLKWSLLAQFACSFQLGSGCCAGRRKRKIPIVYFAVMWKFLLVSCKKKRGPTIGLQLFSNTFLLLQLSKNNKKILSSVPFNGRRTGPSRNKELVIFHPWCI